MKLLAGLRFALIAMPTDRAIVRYLESLGAVVQPLPANLAGLEGIDLLIDGVGLPALQVQGWSTEKIAKQFPQLIHVSVSPFGSKPDVAGFKGSELVASATSGTLRLVGDPDRAPVKEAGDACTFHADMVAAMGAMAAWFEKARGGGGQHVDVSIQEVAFNRNVSSILAWQFDRRKLHRAGGAINYGGTAVRCIWSLSDGWCFHSLMTGKFGAPANQALSDWMDECGAENPLQNVDWLQYNRSRLEPHLRQIWESAIEKFFRTRTKQDILTEGRRRGINASVVATPQDVLADPHLQAREFWTSDNGMRMPGHFCRIKPGAPAVPREINRSNRKGPLSGLRVLDFSWALVGSITTKSLGDLGADVIKVESRGRPCLSRIDVQVSASKPGNFDDKPWFAHLNTSKRSLSLDLKHPDAMTVLGPLIDWADVVVENFSPGTMSKLGLDYASLASRNPAIVMVSGSVYGQSGPLAQEWGIDGTGAALSSRTFLTGWPDRDPVIPGAVPYGDVIVPYVMAATVMAGLVAAKSLQQGIHIDASMYEICVQQMRDAIIASQHGEVPERQGNEDRHWFRQAVLPAAGDDKWIAVSIRDEQQWQTLCSLAQGEDIASWTATQPDSEIVSRLQNASIAAAVVQDVAETLADHKLLSRGALVTLPHPLLGEFGHVRTPANFSLSTPAPYRAPGMGEHNREIVTSICGLDTQQLAALEAKGVFR